MLPFEFIVPGIPVSQQTRRRARIKQWKEFVRSKAGARWPTGAPPVQTNVRITLVYYYDTAALDTDNFVKPVQDALAGLVYDDDKRVTDISIRATDLNGAFHIRGMSPVLAEGFCTGKDFLYIRIDTAPNHGNLL